MALVIQLKRIVLHDDIELCKELVSCAFAKDICDDRQRILFLLDNFVQFSEVADPADSAVFLWDDEGGQYPFTFLLLYKNSQLDEMIKLLFKGVDVHLRYCKRSGIRGLCLWIDINVKILVWVHTKSSVKHFCMAF